MNEVLTAIKNRRSIRKYKEEQIGEQELQYILEAGLYAPSAHNDQSWHFTVIQNKELLVRMNAIAKEGMANSPFEWMNKMATSPGFTVTYNAPTLIVVSGRKDAMAYQVDCSAAIQNMLIAAESLGIGSVWLGLMRFYYLQEEAASALGIPQGYEPFYAVSLGYKAEEGKQAAPPRIKDAVNYIR
ncbi:MAG: nitroreductase family protein [Eubacteriales bacterium]